MPLGLCRSALAQGFTVGFVRTFSSALKSRQSMILAGTNVWILSGAQNWMGSFPPR